jgi:hypothetical protein
MFFGENFLQLKTRDSWASGIEQKSPKIKLYIYNRLILDKGTKNMHWRKNSFFNKWYFEELAFYMQKIKTRPLSLILYRCQLKMDQRVAYNT